MSAAASTIDTAASTAGGQRAAAATQQRGWPASHSTGDAGQLARNGRGQTLSAEPQLIRRRMRFERDFTQLPNAWLRDERLSYRARGLLSMLMTHEHGWKVTIKAIAGASPNEGIDAIRSAVHELESVGYLVRHSTGHRGRFQGDHWEIRDPREAVDNSLLTALDDPTRRPTALDEPTRTALDDPTPIEHKKKNLTTQPSHRGARAPLCTDRQPALEHAFTGDGATCDRCGISRDGTYRTDPITGMDIAL